MSFRRGLMIAALLFAAALSLLATPSASAASGQLTGKVTDAITHAGLGGVGVDVYDSSGSFFTAAATAADGTYAVSGLGSGSYRVGFQPFSGRYGPQFYNGKSSLASADPVAVSAGSTTSGIDAALAAAGQVTGRVTDAATHVGLGGVGVDVYDSSGNFLTAAATAADGTYAVSGLGSGSYRVGFQPASGNYGPQFYNGKSSLASADPVAVSAGSTTSGIDAALLAGGRLTGKVTDAATNAGLGGVEVDVYDSSGDFLTGATTAGDGAYGVSGLGSGAYRVGFRPVGGNYLPQFYNGKSSLASADPVPVTAGSTTYAINAALVAAGQVTGRVTDAATHAGLGGVAVNVYDQNGNSLTAVTTAADGSYTVSGLAGGNYRLGFQPISGNYLPQFYSGKSSLASADPVAVSAGSTTSGIDAALLAGGQLSGRVTDAITHAGLGGVGVDVYDTSGDFLTGAATAADGTYTVSGLASGSYRLGFQPVSGNYLPQFYDGKPSLASADPVTVSAGSLTSAINAELSVARYSLALSLAGAGSGMVRGFAISCPGSCSQTYGSGRVVSLTAVPAAGSTFVGWSGACSGTGGCSVTMVSDQSVTATFAVSPPPRYLLALSLAGAGSGMVRGFAISCPGSCSQTYGSGRVVSLTAVPAAGSTFVGWSGACSGTGGCSVTMVSDQTVTATFAPNPPPQYSLAVSLTGSGAGNLTGSGISCPGTCSQTYVSGTLVSLTAVPDAGSTFVGWGGACSGTGICSLLMASDQAVTALFTANTPPLTTMPPPQSSLAVSLGGKGSGTVTGSGIACPGTCSQTYASSIVASLTAIPAAGSSFAGWSGACSGTAACSVAMTSDQSVMAMFNVSGAAKRPSISALGETHSRFAVAPASTPLRGHTSSKHAEIGTVWSFVLDRVATVTIVIVREAAGVRGAKGCRADRHPAHHTAKCSPLVTIATLTRGGRIGKNRVRFTGRIRRHALKPGRYRSSFVAKNAAGASPRKTLSFAVVLR